MRLSLIPVAAVLVIVAFVEGAVCGEPPAAKEPAKASEADRHSPPPQCHGVADPNVLALGDWSEPVANKYGLKLRGRLSICEYPEHRGHSGTDTALYVELQEYSDFVGAIGEVFWAPESLSCELTDGSGKAVPCSGGAYGGPTPPASWIKLPSNSSLRLRVSPYGGGKLTDGGFDLWANLPQTWTLEPKDTNAYFLSGVLTIKSPNDYKPTDFQWVWTGTLKLPKMKLSLETLRGVKQESPPAGAADEIAAKEPAKASTAGRYAPSPQNHASLARYANAVISLKDPKTGTVFYVESDGRRLVALGSDGHMAWTTDVIGEAAVQPPHDPNPVIRSLMLYEGGLDVVCGRKDHVKVDIQTGKPQYLGRN